MFSSIHNLLSRALRRELQMTEPMPTRSSSSSGAVVGDADGVLAGSLNIRHVDAGSCNGCEVELGMIFAPQYDAERVGIRIVASPRHADVLTVTGPVTKNMATSLRRVHEATPNPKWVVALGDCAINCGVFKGAYAIEGSVGEVVPVDLEIPGCPPEPAVIIEALRRLGGK